MSSMISLSIGRQNKAHLAYSALAAVFITFLSTRALSRAPWIDEVMLYGNYPLRSLFDAIRPLEHYDQAATPLYSLLYGYSAGLETPIVRGIHLATMLFASIWILSRQEKTGKSVIVAAIVVTALPASLSYMSEMKHYGLEAISALGIATWFINREPSKSLTIRDFFWLSIFTLLGLATLPLAGLAILLHLGLRRSRGYKLTGAEISLFILTLILLAGYYMVIKEITIFQMSNYPKAYAYKGPAEGAKMIFRLVRSLLPAERIGYTAILAAFVLMAVDIRKSPTKRQLCIIVAATFAMYSFLATLHLYPAFSTRHIIWFSGFTWVLTYQAACPLIASAERRRDITLRPMIIAAAAVILGLSIQSILNILNPPISLTSQDTYHAINYIRSNPSMRIAVYGGAQPVIDYYSKIYKDLKKQVIIGEINIQSADALLTDAKLSPFLNPDTSKPGAWARLWQRESQYNSVLLDTLDQAPRNADFLLFTYWTGWLGQPGAAKEHELDDEQLSLVRNHGCSIHEHLDYGTADIYRMACRQL